MALISCPECNREISDKAESCPHCGYPIKQSTITTQNKAELYSLKLLSTVNKVKAIKLVREIMGNTLVEAKRIVEMSPIIIAKGLSKDEVTKMAQPFYNNLISVEICNDSNDTVDFNLKPQPPKNQYYYNEPINNNIGSTQINRPHCPTCNSTNIQKISLTQKAIGGAMFGLFSSKVRKTFGCKNCGYKW